MSRIGYLAPKIGQFEKQQNKKEESARPYIHIQLWTCGGDDMVVIVVVVVVATSQIE